MKTTISYKENWWSNWTHYNQLVRIDNDLKEKYNEFVQKVHDRINKKINKTHIITNSDSELLIYLKKIDKWINYISLTWKYPLYHILDKKNLKRLLNRNTIIEVI
jgi:hypothetical protein